MARESEAGRLVTRSCSLGVLGESFQAPQGVVRAADVAARRRVELVGSDASGEQADRGVGVGGDDDVGGMLQLEPAFQIRRPGGLGAPRLCLAIPDGPPGVVPVRFGRTGALDSPQEVS